MAIIFWLSLFVIFYTYGGYPLLVALFAQLKPRTNYNPKSLSNTDLPSVTLLIAAYNEQTCIAEKLNNALSLEYPSGRLQIIVAADGSTDDTVEIVKRFGSRGVELSYAPLRGGKTAAINHAMKAARGEIVVISDANNHYEANTLIEIVAPFGNPNVGAVTGAKTVVSDESRLSASEGFYWKYESFIKKHESRLGTCVAATGEVLGFRSSLFEPYPTGLIQDDFYLAMRIIARGYRMVYAPLARSLESVSLSARDEVTRRARIVAGRFQALLMAPRYLSFHRPLVMWQVVSHKYLRLLLPFAMVTVFVSNVILIIFPTSSDHFGIFGLSPPYNLIAMGCQLAFYLLALVGPLLKQDGKAGKILYLPSFLVRSNWATFIGLLGYWQGHQTSLWQKVARK